MGAPTKDRIRELASFDAGDAEVVSVYLGLAGIERAHPERSCHRLERLARRMLGTNGSRRQVADDLERIEEYVRSTAAASSGGVRAMAVFSCAPRDLWVTFELPVPVRDQLSVDRRPRIGPLERLSERHRRIGVLLADKQRARVVVVQAGIVLERRELFDELPRHEDDRGDWDKDHVHDHQRSAVRQHLRRAAQVAFEVFQEVGFEHLVIATPTELGPALERELHSYLAQRLSGRLTVPVGASDAEIRRMALAIEAEIERESELQLVRNLIERLPVKGALSGLTSVLGAFNERRIAHLVVSDGFESPGWWCRRCSILATVGRQCSACGAEMESVPDVVSTLVDLTVAADVAVTTCDRCPDLDVHGRIGALLRF